MKSQVNRSRVEDELFERLSMVPGFQAFSSALGPLAQYASTPGWEDDSGAKTQAGAKPIGMAQWGAAMTTAGIITEAVKGAPWPTPGVDPKGFIWLTWRISDSAELALQLQANLLSQTYQWTTMRNGMRSGEYSSSNPRDVMEALRAVMGTP